MKVFSIPVLTALVCVYFFWGTTYIAMKFAIESFPPYTMLAARFGLAGLIMYAALRLMKVEAPTRNQWKASALVGGMLLAASTGTISFAETVVPSNVAACIVASVPLWIALFQWALFRQGAPGLWTSVGLVLGFVGVAMLVNISSGKESSGPLWGYLLVVFAAVMWALGSLVSSVSDMPKSPFMAIAAQMLCGAFFCLLAGVLRGEMSEIGGAVPSARSVAAVLYLVTFGSLVGYTAYIWLLRNISPTLVSTYAYVNPVVAIMTGWLLAGETLEMKEAAAVVMVLAAVVAIIKGNGKKAG